MLVRLLLLFVLAMSHGFLLQTNSPLNLGTVGNQHYITKSELYNTLQNEVNFVRNDLNKTLDLLTSQLQQMLSSFQQQITTQGLKYNEVMENYTKLQDKFNSLDVKYTKQEIELQSAKNKTIVHEDEIANLNSLKNICSLTDVRLLQQEIQSIGAQTHSLAVNEEARTQDFQALYNTLKAHEFNADGIIQSLNSTLYQNIHNSEISANALLSNVMTRISESENRQNSRIEELKKSVNVSFQGINQQIAKNSEKVVLTACADDDEFGAHPPGYIIKYRDIRTQVNMNNLPSFRSSGKFTCEKEGLYLVSAWASSDLSGSEFSIYKNGYLIVNAEICNGCHGWYSATAVVAVELLPNDTVWVQVRVEMGTDNQRDSCITIVKVQ